MGVLRGIILLCCSLKTAITIWPWSRNPWLPDPCQYPHTSDILFQLWQEAGGCQTVILACLGTYLLYGHLQVESKDVTLDDLWKLDLVKFDGWTCVRENSVGQELVDDNEWSTDDENSKESDDGDGEV